MLKYLILTLSGLAVIFAAEDAYGQRIERVKRRLAESSYTENGIVSVQVHEAAGAADVVRRADAAPAQQSVSGYRIVIFFDNGATARAEAERNKTVFEASYPDVRCDIRYENPYFKVVAGCCVTSDEAVMLLERVHRDFPQAYIMREDIALQYLITPKRVENNSLPESDGSTEGV